MAVMATLLSTILAYGGVAHGFRQPNAPIQPAMARPISSGESSWT